MVSLDQGSDLSFGRVTVSLLLSKRIYYGTYRFLLIRPILLVLYQPWTFWRSSNVDHEAIVWVFQWFISIPLERIPGTYFVLPKSSYILSILIFRVYFAHAWNKCTVLLHTHASRWRCFTRFPIATVVVVFFLLAIMVVIVLVILHTNLS